MMPSFANALRVFVLLGLTATLFACTTSRTSTTARTAVEEALLSQSAEATIEAFRCPELSGRSFTISEDYFEAVDGKYVLGTLRKHLISQGMHPAPDPATAELIIYPTVANAGIDDKTFTLGIPPLPIELGQFGMVQFPEFALVRHHSQLGRNRMSLHAVWRESGQPAFWTDEMSSERKYNRWLLLFFIAFRVTDLEEPF